MPHLPPRLASIYLTLAMTCAMASAQDGFDDGYRGGTIKGLPRPKKALHFLVVGDWGRVGEYRQRDVAEQMGRAAHTLEAEFVISTGDNFYPNGVASVHDPLWERSFEGVYTAHSLQEEWYPVLGNHDYRGNPDAQLAYAGISRRWRMPARYHFIERKASDGAKVLLIFLDTNPFEKKYYDDDKEPFRSNIRQRSDDTTRQKEWLLNTLRSSDARWKFVIGHHPLYSSGKRRDETQSVASSLLPLLEKGGADAYLCGHEHQLEHDVFPSGLHQFISGAGSEVRPVGRADRALFTASEAGFLAISAHMEAVNFTFINHEGRLMYGTRLEKPRQAGR